MIDSKHWIEVIETACLKNKYTKWYVSLVKNATNRSEIIGYTEMHHIVPKCFNLGGQKEKSNLVRLTGKEHYIAHLLLSRMVEDKKLMMKLSCALLRMSFTNGVDRHKINSNMYQIIKMRLSQSKTGIFGKKWTDSQREKLRHRIPHNKGKPMSIEQKEKLREVRKKQIIGPRKDETKSKIRAAFLGKKRSKETVEKMKLNQRYVTGYLWWTNGIEEKRSVNAPGDHWVQGRLRR